MTEAPLQAGTRLGKYELVRRLASGGMGDVWLACQHGPAGFAKSVVVKTLLSHLADDRTFIELFLNEARLAALLSHPNIVHIYELGIEGGCHFIAMELVEGRSLRQVCRALARSGEVMPPLLAARICAEALRALHFAHSFRGEAGRLAPIIHRDVSPDNLLVGFNGTVKLADFGIAKAVREAGDAVSSALRGKYGYLAPEQLRRGAVDARTDVFSLGVVLYELLAGKRPFDGETPEALLSAICLAEPPGPEVVRPGIPPSLAEVAKRALSKAPENRFQSAQEMGSALEDFIAGSKTAVTPEHVSSFLETVASGQSAATTTPHPSPSLGPEEVDRIALTLVEPERRLQGEGGALLPLLPESLSPAATQTISEASASPASSRRPWVVPAGLLVLTALVGFGLRDLARSRVEAVRPPPPVAKPPLAVVSVSSEVSAERPTVAETEGNVAPEAPQRAAVDAGGGPSRSGNSPRLSKTGRLNVRVYPWAEVFLGKRRLGQSPLSGVEVPAGRQVFILRNRDLLVEKKVELRIPPGGEAQLNADLTR